MDDSSRPTKSAVGSAPTGKTSSLTADQRFAHCRWGAMDGRRARTYCDHKDVRPIAGVTGFSCQAWCSDCDFFKRGRPAHGANRVTRSRLSSQSSA